MNTDPEELANYRDALLLIQSGALLHNMGKVTSQFFEWQVNEANGSAPQFKYQHILHLIEADCSDLQNKLSNLYNSLQATENQNVLDVNTISSLMCRFTLTCPFDDRPYYRPGDLIEYLGSGKAGKLEDDKPLYGKPGEKHWIIAIFQNGSRLTHLMNRTHHGASGGEKQDIYAVGQKNLNDLYRATPFGWESRVPTLIDIDDHKHEIEKIIQNCICFDDTTPLDFDGFAKEVHPHIEAVIADTRRPLNDVTVWDIGHSGMAFLLTQSIELMAQGRSIDHDPLATTGDENTLFWRVLSIRLDGLGYLEGASSLADLRVRYRLLQEAMDRVRSALEGIPVATEVYRDENGSFYIFPDLSDKDPLTKDVRNILQSKLAVDGIALNWSLSEQLVNHPKDKGKYIGEYICEQINSESGLPKSHDLAAYTTPWQSTTNKEICVACGIRPQGYGAKEVEDYREDIRGYSKKAQLRKLCCICMDRRHGVAELWATKGLQDATVWIDEVADENGRLALVVGQFDLNRWEMYYPKAKEHSQNVLESPKTYLKVLNLGEYLKNDEIVTIKDCDFKYDKEIDILKADVKKDGISKFMRKNFPQINIEIDSIQREGTGYKIVLCKKHGKDVAKKHSLLGVQFIATDEQTLVTIDKDAAQKVERTFLYNKRLVVTGDWDLYAMAESQSFARIRRVWETTRRFWQEILPTDKEAEISESVGGMAIGLVGHRLRIEGKLHSMEKDGTPGQYHAYELPLLGAKLSVVWVPEDDGNGGYFVTAKNPLLIARLLGKTLPDHDKTESVIEYQKRLHEWAAETLEKEIRGRVTLTIEEPTGYGSQNKVWGTITINDVTEIPHSTYTPAIPILAEPRTFMALVPADKALDVMSKINEKYEREMGKVRNRLPLHLGVVFAPYKTPLRAIMDAGRRMLGQTAPVDGWEVVKKSLYLLPSVPHADLLHFAKYVRLELTQDDRSEVWYVPLRMGDGKTTDEWYPYVFVENDKDGKPPTGRKRMFEAPCPWNRDDDDHPQPTWLVHAEDLRCRYVDENGNEKAGDMIYFTPATVDFQWLDTSGRRFEIAYGDKGRRLSIPQRPYLSNEFENLHTIWDTLSDHLTSTQIHALREMIEAKREEWGISEESGDESKTFWQFCRDAIANLEWKKCNGKYPWERDGKTSKTGWLNTWADYTVHGWLDDTIELYMQIMKEKPKYEKERLP